MNKCLDCWLHSLECFPWAQFWILTVKNQLSAFDEKIITRTNNCYPCKPQHFHCLYSDKRYKSAPRPLISAISSWLLSCVWSTDATAAGQEPWVYLTKPNPKCGAERSLQRLRFWGCSSETSSAYPHYLSLSHSARGDGSHCCLPALITTSKKLQCFHNKQTNKQTPLHNHVRAVRPSIAAKWFSLFVFMYCPSHLYYSSMADTNC